MDLSQLKSIATSGTSAASTVASALSSRRAVQATPKDATTQNGNSSNAASGSSDITSDDFLTLLVSELKNQDPTQPTDPNQYITQLAQVNSLQQLISINQGIGTLDDSISGTNSSTSGGSGSGSGTNAVEAAVNANARSAPHAVPGRNASWGSTVS
jgi:flagellar basal-body rod modification protein FlgD